MASYLTSYQNKPLCAATVPLEPTHTHYSHAFNLELVKWA